ncbi:hypothetical protein F3Y22_tig00111582pilonHSYRG00752 [Hibiscus syriacus]|uniref:NB-ARC domain-containing protein n=1 Tax=Hibiscus syriacus TaxID=106335 RepID=A0A6A2YJP7_HIBSY|nr:hypothetical protein F3Y22_tig00111582pilonHSYRG00752 [Hibiscus syriacus]
MGLSGRMTVGTREPYMQHKEIKEAQGTKTAAQGVEHAIAGTSTYVVVTDEDVEDLKEAIKDDMQSFYMQGTDLIEGIKLDMTQTDNLHLCSTIFEKMHNLKYILFGVPQYMRDSWNEKLRVDGVDNVSLPEELRYLCWDFYPFKSLPSSFSPKNLVVLKLQHGNMEQLWNEDGHLWFKLEECYSLSKFPELPNNFVYLKLEKTRIEEVPDSIEHLVELGTLFMKNSRNPEKFNRIRLICSSIQKLECNVSLSGSVAVDVSSPIMRCKSLGSLAVDHCESLKLLSELPPCLWLLDAHGCTWLVTGNCILLIWLSDKF